ncbi:divalent cation tolerance protein CutA [Fodinicola acaciae]|uniref:divalent cation tolerance protein CutA n=1 Tax=Fodinicola acaciae TaxID=2681555 RepID=UPI0013D5C5AB|nr:divalent cation tolerance protein CutA [Fodinicola acaciae]
MSDEPVCRVTITAPDADWLMEFSRQLVSDRLAAGAHNIAPIRAVYRWDNQINDKPEAMLICHTKMSLVDEIVQRVNDQHPYARSGCGSANLTLSAGFAACRGTKRRVRARPMATPDRPCPWRHRNEANRWLCDAAVVGLVWVTGSSGVGKSTVCTLLKSRGEQAVDADWDGYNHWVDRKTGQVVVDPPYPAPAGWLDRFGWRISRAKIEALAESTSGDRAFLFGTVENENEVWDLFDLVVCLVVDNTTLRDRLLTRTTNAFGKHPEELVAALQRNAEAEASYRRFGATIISSAGTPEDVAAAILAAAGHLPRKSRPDQPLP